jgi:apolipoprotein N-acyltransferase
VSDALDAKNLSLRRSVGRNLATVGLLTLGAILFWLAFPSVLFRFGAYPVAFIALIPVAIAVRRMRWWATPLYGALYGFAAYALFNYWLATFHPLAIFIVPLIYAGYFFVLFPVLWLADRLFGRWAFLAQALVWMSYEWFRTQGYLGYSYGIMGYSLFPAPLLIQVAELGAGVLHRPAYQRPLASGDDFAAARIRGAPLARP